MTRVAVIGGGITGLAAAHELATARPDLDVVLFEGARRTGGLVRTERTPAGLVLEHGADSLFLLKPHARETLHALDLDTEVVSGTGGPRTAYVARSRELVPLPSGMLGLTPRSALGLLFSPLLSLRAKMRLLLEPFMPRSKPGEDESLRAFVTRRFGAAFLELVLEPLISGIHGAAPERLSAGAVMPQLVALERTHGSITWALTRASERRVDGPAVVSLRRGMGSLGARYAERLGPRVRVASGVKSVQRLPHDRFALSLDDGSTLEVDGLVIATSAWDAARLCEPLAAALSHELASVESTGYTSVHLAFRRDELGPLPEGTGFVVPLREAKHIKACSWITQKWPDRAPPDVVLLRCFLRNGDAAPSGAIDAALRDLRDVLELRARPVFSHVVSRARALPSYTLGHLDRVARIEQAMDEQQRVGVAGNYLRGMGIPDCIGAGKRAAMQVARSL